jgi:hypothetical protein
MILKVLLRLVKGILAHARDEEEEGKRLTRCTYVISVLKTFMLWIMVSWEYVFVF